MNELHEIMKTQSSDINYNDAYNQKKKKKWEEERKNRNYILAHLNCFEEVIIVSKLF